MQLLRRALKQIRVSISNVRACRRAYEVMEENLNVGAWRPMKQDEESDWVYDSRWFAGRTESHAERINGLFSTSVYLQH
jgi:hypothetical protein